MHLVGKTKFQNVTNWIIAIGIWKYMDVSQACVLNILKQLFFLEVLRLLL